MANRSKQKGTAFETQCVNYLKKFFPKVYRPALQGGLDTGDINGVHTAISTVIFQCKNHKSWDVSGWLNATKQQAVNMGHNALPVLLVKRKAVGNSNMGKTYAVMELSDLARLLQEAGYR